MHIRVSDIDSGADGSRAYAEYRVFTAIAAYESRVRGAEVVVQRDAAADGQFLCTVTVDLAAAGRIRTQARALHPVAAIDRAAQRTARLVGRTSRRVGCKR